MIGPRLLIRALSVGVASCLIAVPGRAQRAEPARFVTTPLALAAWSSSAAAPQIRVAQPRRAGPVRRGLIMGGVIGGGLMITWLILEDMLGGDLLVKDNAKNGITPTRILTYTAAGVGVGATVGGAIGYISKRRAERASASPSPSLSSAAPAAER